MTDPRGLLLAIGVTALGFLLVLGLTAGEITPEQASALWTVVDVNGADGLRR